MMQKKVKNIFITVAAIGGILLDKISSPRIILLLLIGPVKLNNNLVSKYYSNLERQVK
jgi:hypothetical protein